MALGAGESNAGPTAPRVTVVGAGLAGCEAAWQAARRGLDVTLYEMKPVRFSPAHESEAFAGVTLLCGLCYDASRELNAEAGG